MQYINLVLAATASDKIAQMRPALTVLFVIFGLLAFVCIVLTALALKSKKTISGGAKLRLGMLYITTIIVLICTLACRASYVSAKQQLSDNPPETSAQHTTASTQTNATTVETTEAPTEATVPEPTYEAEHVKDSDPKNWKIKWDIIANNEIVKKYQRPESITFGKDNEYTQMQGIITFRGNNYRNSPTYGTAEVVNKTLSEKWNSNIGSLNGWPGSGWTGQPLIVRWDEETKAIMNLKESKKEKENLVEVIYATLDGYVYFYDLDDGSYTRDPFFVGMNFKGAGALDPRGYPLMYVGSGDYYSGKTPRMYILDLINCKVIYEQSGSDSYTLRKDWTAFDSSPLVDAETDTLIWPGENGILYTMKLNTKYNPEDGKISVKPEQTVKIRYSTSRSGSGSYWLGFEPSCAIVGRYLYISENGGMFFCIDLDTMKLVWAQDTRDDSNSTPVFQWDESGETGYIYTAPSLHWTARNDTGKTVIYKLNAKTGEIVWQKPYDCYTVSGVSGGVQATGLLGKEGTDMENLIIYPIARTPNSWEGVLVAFDTETGEVVWEHSMANYAWSSPAGVYTEDGKGYVVICDSAGKMAFLDGKTGEELSSISLGSNIEASPAVFENTIVVGTRGQKIYGVEVN